jgi:DNA-binding MarR family transcriptional regulator
VEVHESVSELSPAAKLVYFTLHREGPGLSRELASAALLDQRTTRDALQRLQDAGVVASRPSVRDARADVYYLEGVHDPGFIWQGVEAENS